METIWERGALLAERESNRFRFILYQVDEFYVEEIRYLKWNVWYGYKCYTDTEELQTYLNDIDITQFNR